MIIGGEDTSVIGNLIYGDDQNLQPATAIWGVPDTLTSFSHRIIGNRIYSPFTTDGREFGSEFHGAIYLDHPTAKGHTIIQGNHISHDARIQAVRGRAGFSPPVRTEGNIYEVF
jgi:hypothetical protein